MVVAAMVMIGVLVVVAVRMAMVMLMVVVVVVVVVGVIVATSHELNIIRAVGQQLISQEMKNKLPRSALQ